MPDRYIEIDGVLREVRFPEDPAIATRTGLVWRAAFVDETNGQPVGARIVPGGNPDLDAARDARSGQAGLVAAPTKTFPDLVATPVPVSLRAEAAGYLNRDITDQIVAHPNHPDDFNPATPPQPIEMQTLPMRLEGQVRRRVAGELLPVAGALVEITGIWPQAQQGSIAPPIDPANMIEIRPALGEEALAGTTVRRVTLGSPGPDTTLAQSAPPGAREIMLTSRGGLSVGHLIALEPDHPDRFEIARIEAIAPLPPSPHQGVVTLSQPLAFGHSAASAVSRRTASAAGPVRSLSSDVIPGGVTLPVDDPGGLTTSGFVRVDSGATAQVRRVRAYSTTSDANGNFRLPPIHRISRAFVSVSDAISALADLAWVPSRDGPSDRLDIELPP